MVNRNKTQKQNHSISELTRVLLIESKLHIKFWSYTVLFEINIMNNIPHSTSDKIPYARIFNNLPNYRNRHPFGFKIFILDMNQSKSKFASRPREIFLNYRTIL